MSTPANETKPTASTASTALTASTASVTAVKPATPGPVTETTSVLPAEKTLMNAAKIALEQDRPILLDYYKETREGTAFIGEDPDTKERILLKSASEFTSPISKIYKSQNDFIILTENSIYIVSGAVKKQLITTGNNSRPSSNGKDKTV